MINAAEKAYRRTATYRRARARRIRHRLVWVLMLGFSVAAWLAAAKCTGVIG